MKKPIVDNIYDKEFESLYKAMENLLDDQEANLEQVPNEQYLEFTNLVKQGLVKWPSEPIAITGVGLFVAETDERATSKVILDDVWMATEPAA